MEILINLAKNRENMSAVFIIAFVSLFILAGFVIGFSLPLFIISMAVSAVVAFIYPRSGIYAIVFLTFIYERFFTLQPVVWGMAEYKLYPIDIIFGAVILGIIWQIIFRGSTSINQNDPRRLNLFKLKKIDYFLFVFIFLSGLYFLVSAYMLKTEMALAFSSFKNYAFYSLFYFVIIYLFDKKDHLIRLLKFALVGAVGIIFFIFYGVISGQGLWSEYTPLSTEGMRLLAFTHAFYLSLILLGVLTYLIFEKLKHSNVYFILGAIWSFGIVGSMMRHLWLGLIAAAAGLFLIIPRERRLILVRVLLKYLMIFASFAVIVFYLSFLFPGSSLRSLADSAANVIYERANSFSDVSSDDSFFWRNVVWKEATKEYVKNPIFGIGLGKYVYVEIEKYKDFVEVRNIHNSPLVLLVQMGAVTFFAFIALIYGNIKRIFSKPEKDWPDYLLITLMVFYLVVFLFQPYLEANLLGIFFWIILGLIRVKSYEDTGNQQI
jgi:O-antigen ligase